MSSPPYGSGDGDGPDLTKRPESSSQPESGGAPGAPPPYNPTPGAVPPPYDPNAGGYGTPTPYGGGYGAPKPKGLAIAALVCGIVSIVLACIPLIGLPTGIAGIVCGIIGGNKVKEGLADGAGMAKAGLICGIVGLVFSIGWMILGGMAALQDFGNM